MYKLLSNILFFCISIAICDELSSMHIEDTKFKQNRYAVIKSYAMTGMRNIRWETVPVNYVDSNGKNIF